MKEIYLKGYYGYRNLGDALLLIGVLHYIQQHFAPKKVTIEVQDVSWATKRYDDNKSHFPSTMQLRRKKTPGIRGKCGHMLRSAVGLFPFLILGGGEVVNTGENFPHNGRNYIMLYRGNIIRKRYALMGGITTQGEEDAVAKFLIRNAHAIIVRESGSYDQALPWFPRTVLYQDFAKELIQTTYDLGPKSKNDTSPYILINAHPSKVDATARKAIDQFLAVHPDKKIYFVPCDMVHDMSFIKEVKERYPQWELYDRTGDTLEEIVGFFAGASAAWGMRLHFLLLCHECHVPFEMIVYHDKVRKVLGIEGVV